MSMLQAQTRRHLAKRRGNWLVREKRAVISVQCAYRCRIARRTASYQRVIRYQDLATIVSRVVRREGKTSQGLLCVCVFFFIFSFFHCTLVAVLVHLSPPWQNSALTRLNIAEIGKIYAAN